MATSILDILNRAFELEASDLFLVGGAPVTYKVHGRMVREGERLIGQTLDDIIADLYARKGRELKPLDERTDDDFSFSLAGLARFRVNVFYQRGSISAVIRMLRFGIPTPQEMRIPQTIMDLSSTQKGMILVTGAVGSGKSTTIACLIDRINREYDKNIITMEDPIEYIHQHNRSIVSQREVPTDVPDFPVALRAALRECPDVLFVGEMRDNVTIATAITAAETGRLVISTLHTMSAADTIDRIVDSFPPAQQSQIRFQLSRVLRCVICQQLIPGIDGKQYPAFEIMKVTPAIANLIREGKTYQLPGVIQVGKQLGMKTMKASIDELVADHLIDRRTAASYYDEQDSATQ